MIQFPRVGAQANHADPYIPPLQGTGQLKPVYQRSDRNPLKARSKAISRPDFTGSWSTTELNTVSVINRLEKSKMANLGSGWGNKISIYHKADVLEMERVFFIPRELQSILQYKYNLNGSQSENDINMGRTTRPLRSVAKWIENRLEITSLFSIQHLYSGQWITTNLIQTVGLSPVQTLPGIRCWLLKLPEKVSWVAVLL